jgi:rhodanese-related sulfurtransferase
MPGMSTIQKSLFRRYQRPVAYLLCLLALALLTQVVPGNATNALAYTILSPTQVKTMAENGTAGTILDVREYDEYCTAYGGHIPCSLNYPWNTGYLQTHYTELDPDAPYIIVCKSGSRSTSASAFLESLGFTKIYIMSGGMSSWQGATQSCEAGCPALYFPHVATSIPWQTEIAIINTGDQALTGTLKGSAMTVNS